MPTNVTKYTTQEEINQILEQFQTDLALNNAIENKDSGYEVEDLVTAYMQKTGELPSVLLVPDPNDEDLSYLWEDEEMIDALRSWKATHGSENIATEIENFLNALGVGEGSNSVINDTQKALEDIIKSLGEEKETEENDDKYLDLFNSGELQKILAAFMHNVGLGLLIYSLFRYNPSTKELIDSALEVIEDAEYERDDLQEELLFMDATGPNAQSEIRALESQLQTINQVINIMNEFISTANSALQDFIRNSSQIAQQEQQTQQFIINQ